MGATALDGNCPLTVDISTFLAAMAALPGPVTVLTLYDESGEPRGMTVSAVCSLSLHPPLVLVCIGKNATMYDAVLTASTYALHLLRPGDEDVARRFAGPAADRFVGQEIRHDVAPLLTSVTDRLLLTQYGVRDGGDHSVILASVTEAHGLEEPSEHLVWHGRRFHATCAEQVRDADTDR